MLAIVKTVTLTLIAAGSVLMTGAGWLSWVLPLRDEAMPMGDGTRVIGKNTIHKNVWGVPLSCTIWIHRKAAEFPKVEEREVLDSGPMNGADRQGRWECRERDQGGPWIMKFVWYIHGKEVSERDWEAVSDP